MREFGADLAAINPVEQLNNVAQLHALVARSGKTAREKLGIHVGFGQTEILQLQNARDRTFHDAQRIDIGYLVTAQAIDLDEP